MKIRSGNSWILFDLPIEAIEGRMHSRRQATSLMLRAIRELNLKGASGLAD